MTRSPLRLCLLSCLLSGLLLTSPLQTSPAHAKSAKSAKSTKKRAKSSQKGRKSAATANKSKASKKLTAAQKDVDAVLRWLRKHIEQSKKSNKPSDLPTQLLAGLFQLSIPNIVHGQYALAGTGQALRRGAIPKDQAQAVARDMARNFERLTQIFVDLAKTPALQGQVGAFFSAVGGVTVKGQAAAVAMGTYAADPDQKAAASAFEQALETYRAAIKDLLSRVK